MSAPVQLTRGALAALVGVGSAVLAHSAAGHHSPHFLVVILATANGSFQSAGNSSDPSVLGEAGQGAAHSLAAQTETTMILAHHRTSADAA
jgi:parvulin-like peptidyl-prolyl isomerase